MALLSLRTQKMKQKRPISLILVMVAVVMLSVRCNTTPAKDTHVATTISQRSFVFGEDRTFPKCHASTLVRLPTGAFLVASFAGTAEKDDDVGIWI